MTLIIFNCDSIILFPVLHLNLQFKKNSNAEAEKLEKSLIVQWCI